jgi:bla regulator protein BlaR1
MTIWLPSALMNHLWQSTVCVLLVWLAGVALRNNGARVRCWLWAGASLKFLVPFSVLVSLGERFQWGAAPAAVQPAVSFVMKEVLAPAREVIVMPASAPQSSSLWPWLLATAWCAGAAVVLVSWWRQWLPIRSAVRRATFVCLDAGCHAADLPVMSSPAMPEPGVVGIFRPRLVLPEGLVEHLTPPQLQALIAHERCHVRSHDNLVAAVHMVVEALFWFHPAVWWIERRLVEERERACDEAVLRAGSRPQDYAEGILAVCRQSAGERLACAAGVSGSNLRARVEAIMRNETGHPMTPRRRFVLALAIAAAVGGPVAGGALTIQSQVVVPPVIPFEGVSVQPSKAIGGLAPVAFDMEAHLLKKALSSPRDGRLRFGGSLRLLIQAAYGVTGYQVEGGPPWVASDRYAIEARTESDATPEEIRSMLQSLLAERFQLSLRREVRHLPVYELTVANGGLRIAAMKNGECTPSTEVRWDLIDLEAPLYVCGGGGRRRALSQNPETRPRPEWPRVDRLEFGQVSMPTLIDLISGDLDRLVVDKTGFTETFNLLLDFAPASRPESRLPPYSGPTIFAALEEQLGLSLVSAESPVEVLVIDRAERPPDN